MAEFDNYIWASDIPRWMADKFEPILDIEPTLTKIKKARLGDFGGLEMKLLNKTDWELIEKTCIANGLDADLLKEGCTKNQFEPFKTALSAVTTIDGGLKRKFTYFPSWLNGWSIVVEFQDHRGESANRNIELYCEHLYALQDAVQNGAVKLVSNKGKLIETIEAGSKISPEDAEKYLNTLGHSLADFNQSTIPSKMGRADTQNKNILISNKSGIYTSANASGGRRLNINTIPEHCFYNYSIRITVQRGYPELNEVGNPDFKQKHFEIKFRNETLNKQCFYGYLGSNDFIPVEMLIDSPRNKDSVSIIVSMGKIRGINTADYFNMVDYGIPTPHELELHEDARARYLDSDYSITNFFRWLASKGVYVPRPIYDFADEIQKWQQVPELQTEAVGNDGADSQAPTNQTTTETHNAKEDGQNDVTPKAKALERLKNLEQYIETLENQAKAKDIEFDKMDLLLTKQQVLNELKKRYPNFKIKIDAFEPVWKLATKKQICANQRANTKNGEEFLKSILG